MGPGRFTYFSNFSNAYARFRFVFLSVIQVRLRVLSRSLAESMCFQHVGSCLIRAFAILIVIKITICFFPSYLQQHIHNPTISFNALAFSFSFCTPYIFVLVRIFITLFFGFYFDFFFYQSKYTKSKSGENFPLPSIYRSAKYQSTLAIAHKITFLLQTSKANAIHIHP